MEQAIPDCFRDVMRMRGGAQEKEEAEAWRGRPSVNGATLPLGVSVQWDRNHWVSAVPVLYAAQGSLSGGGDIFDGGHGEDGEVFGHVPKPEDSGRHCFLWPHDPASPPILSSHPRPSLERNWARQTDLDNGVALGTRCPRCGE